MKDRYDPWFVRLPDGRILNAKSSASVRHHIEAGNIPLNSSARRDPEDEWQALARIEEFGDLIVGGNRSLPSLNDIPPTQSANGSSADLNLQSGVSGRLDPMRLQTVGIRGLVDELIAALDSTVNSRKLGFAGLAGIAIVVTTFLIQRSVGLVYPGGAWLANLLSAACGLFILAGAVALLTRQTHLELSRMRPVSTGEATEGLLPFIIRVFLSYLLTIGVGIGLLLVFQRLPVWAAEWSSGVSTTVAEVIATAIGIAGLVLALIVGNVILLSWLIAPVLVVEECSVGDAIREWRALLKEHRVRVLVYEGMALTLAAIAALPVALPVYFALSYGPTVIPNWVGGSVQAAVVGLAFGPALAFLAVANLFIYLNLRYEYTPQR